MIIKTCSSCRNAKPRDEFATDVIGRPGARCQVCVDARFWGCRSCGRMLPMDAFHTRTLGEYVGTPKGPCKSCVSQRNTELKYGLTWPNVVALAAAQGYQCATCPQQIVLPDRDQWVVDHDHRCCDSERTCGKCVRGILCRRCNRALGMAKDNPVILRKMADYVEGAKDASQF